MWAKVDDGWWKHRKSMLLSMAARGLWVTALSYCAGMRTDVVPRPLLDMVCSPFVDDPETLAAELVSAGVWTIHGSDWRIVGLELSADTSDEREDLTWAELELFVRDGWECANCNATCAALQIDHVHPWSQGGADKLDNFQWLCPPCNSSKWAYPQEWWESSGMAARMSATSRCGYGTCGHDTSLRIERITEGSA